MNSLTPALITLSIGLLFCVSCDGPGGASNSAYIGQSEKENGAIPASEAPVELVSTPLPANEPGGSGSLFERLNPADTGVDFVNPIQRRSPLNYLYASAFGCGGVAVGDIDGDGWPDLYFTGGPRPNVLYRQSGDLKFEDVTASAKVASKAAWSAGASMVDIDNDGDLDIYVCNFDTPNHLYLNDGKGAFKESAKKFGLSFVGPGHTPAFCDYDNDGDLDLYLMSNFYYDPRGKSAEPVVAIIGGKPQVKPRFRKYYGIVNVKQGRDGEAVNVEHDSVGQPDRIVTNNGDGTFTEASKLVVGKGNAVVWWDPNDDGFADLYVANDFKDPDAFLENKGSGKFVDVIKNRVPHTTWYSMGADSADLNGDGMPDLMVADMSGTNHFKQKVGMGAMSANVDFLNTAVPRQYMRNTVYLNSGTGRLLEVAHMAGLANSDWTWTVRLSDFDNDGKVDVFLSNGMALNMNVSDNPEAVNALPGETEWEKHVRAGTGPLKEQNLAFRNLGDLEFEDVSKPWGLDHVGMSYGATAADLDRDGDLELIVANLEEPISLYRNHSTEANRILVELRGTQSNKRGLGATVRVETKSGRQMRFLTLTRGYMASGEAVVHFGLGEDETISKLSVRWPSGVKQVFEDLAGNQRFLITEPKEGAPVEDEPAPAPTFAAMKSSLSSVTHRETEYDDYARQPLLPHKHSQLGPGLATGDIDGDGDDDFFVGGAKGELGVLLRNGGGGNFKKVKFEALGQHQEHEDMGAVFLDSDSDGDLDLYVVSGGVECEPGDDVLRDRLYLNDGSGSLSVPGSELVPDLRDSGSSVVACDFDEDGDLDLFVGGRVIPGSYPLPAESRILRNTAGKFADATDEVAPGLRESGLVTGALWTDANGDGKSDLMVTYELGPVRLFANDGTLLTDQTEHAGLAELKGWWNGIAGSDVDHDGDIDYAVTNLGLNTKYHGNAEKPFRLFCGDFDGSGKMHLIEAEYESETLYPVRGFSCSSNAIDSLREKMKTFKNFAMSSLQEIYTPASLDQAHEFTTTEFRSGILLNNGSGVFEFQPLPRIAQIAPGFSVTFSDANTDGNPDLYVVQNFFSPQAEIGRMAGGVSQLLFGSGDGRFDAVAPIDSGLVVPGDAKSLAQTDLNGDGHPDLVVGVNDGRLKVFQHSGSSAEKPLSVRLRGQAGNPTGAGSRVSVNSGDATLTAEVYAGSGYLSQSSATLTFAAGTAKQVEVTWPNGAKSVAAINGKSVVEITQP